MSFRDIQFELNAWTEKLAIPFAQTLTNRALRRIYEESLWSFQLKEGGWFTPGIIGPPGPGPSPGTITTVLGSNQIVGNSAAQTAWNSIPAPFLISNFQIRLAAYNLYSIVSYNPGTGTLTIDRPWMEPFGAGQSYLMYQAYFAAPVQDFKRFLGVRDFQNGAWLWLKYKQSDLRTRDPQRTIYGNPDRVVPYQVDSRQGSSTAGFMLYELWPHQLAQLPYALYYARMGPALVQPTDAAPYPLTDDLLIMRAKNYTYEWKLAQKGVDERRSSGANWEFLLEKGAADYKEELDRIRKVDRDLCDSLVSKIVRNDTGLSDAFYSAVTGSATVGEF